MPPFSHPVVFWEEEQTSRKVSFAVMLTSFLENQSLASAFTQSPLIRHHTSKGDNNSSLQEFFFVYKTFPSFFMFIYIGLFFLLSECQPWVFCDKEKRRIKKLCHNPKHMHAQKVFTEIISVCQLVLFCLQAQQNITLKWHLFGQLIVSFVSQCCASSVCKLECC